MTPVDLLTWPEVDQARRRLAAAEAAREAAAKRARVQMHGDVQNRRKAFQEATHEVLKAAAELQALTRESGR